MLIKPAQRQTPLIPSPPEGAVAWAALLGVVMACAAGGVWVGTLTNRVEVLESFSPLSVDRRLGAIEAQNVAIKEQVEEVKRLLQAQAQDRRPSIETWGARPR